MSINIQIEKFTGTHEEKDARIHVDGVYAGMISRFCPEEFQSAASMRRTTRFEHVEVTIDFNGHSAEASFTAAQGYSSRSATKAAKEWAAAQIRAALPDLYVTTLGGQKIDLMNPEDMGRAIRAVNRYWLSVGRCPKGRVPGYVAHSTFHIMWRWVADNTTDVDRQNVADWLKEYNLN